MRSKPRFRLVPRHLVATAFAGLIPVWAIPLTTISCVPGYPACDPTSGLPQDPACSGAGGGTTDGGDAAAPNPDGGG